MATILKRFSEYVEEYSDEESFTQKFIDFFGKKDLICVKTGSFNDVNKYQKEIIKDFCEQISANIGKELIDILTPNFTTSNENSIIAGKVSIMSTFKNFFDYNFAMISCGIPYIILEGSLNDWENILNKFKFLSKYGFCSHQMEKEKKYGIFISESNFIIDLLLVLLCVDPLKSLLIVLLLIT